MNYIYYCFESYFSSTRSSEPNHLKVRGCSNTGQLGLIFYHPSIILVALYLNCVCWSLSQNTSSKGRCWHTHNWTSHLLTPGDNLDSSIDQKHVLGLWEEETQRKPTCPSGNRTNSAQSTVLDKFHPSKSKITDLILYQSPL